MLLFVIAGYTYRWYIFAGVNTVTFAAGIPFPFNFRPNFEFRVLPRVSCHLETTYSRSVFEWPTLHAIVSLTDSHRARQARRRAIFENAERDNYRLVHYLRTVSKSLSLRLTVNPLTLAVRLSSRVSRTGFCIFTKGDRRVAL